MVETNWTSLSSNRKSAAFQNQEHIKSEVKSSKSEQVFSPIKSNNTDKTLSRTLWIQKLIILSQNRLFNVLLFRTLWCSRSTWWWGNLHPGFRVLRVCCTQAYRTICLPWAAAWKIQRLLLFRKMTEYLPYNPWIHTLTCSSCMASPYCSVHGVLCLQIIEKKNSCTLSVLTAIHTSTCSSVRH